LRERHGDPFGGYQRACALSRRQFNPLCPVGTQCKPDPVEILPSLTHIKDAAANSCSACDTLRKLSLRDTRVLFNAKCGRFWVVLSYLGASAFLLVAIVVLTQDRLTIVEVLIAAVPNSEPLRDISKEMTQGVGVGISCYLCCTAAQGDMVSLKGIAR